MAGVAREVESQSHPYAMSASSRSESLDEPADTPEGRIAARAMEAREAMRSGRPEEAVEELQSKLEERAEELLYLVQDFLPIVMFGTLATLLFTGFPVAFILGGLALLFGLLGATAGMLLIAAAFYLQGDICRENLLTEIDGIVGCAPVVGGP